uniref:WAT1-related protein n=1 Tax=Kalanchoe fedtschenkoi TaxID=63787 RepID=A0A7N0RFJ7_KALFE
ITLVRNFSFAGLSYSSPTIASAMSNMEPSLTFLLASSSGTLVTVLGALTITLHKGSALWASPQSNPPYSIFPSISSNWVFGASCFAVAALSRPVFVAMFGPLGAVMAAIFFEDTLHIGRSAVVGAIIIVSGFYASIWAKSKDGEDHKQDPDRLPSSSSQQT